MFDRSESGPRMVMARRKVRGCRCRADASLAPVQRSIFGRPRSMVAKSFSSFYHTPPPSSSSAPFRSSSGCILRRASRSDLRMTGIKWESGCGNGTKRKVAEGRREWKGMLNCETLLADAVRCGKRNKLMSFLCCRLQNCQLNTKNADT